MKKSTKFLVRTAVIAALYATITLVVYPLSYGAIQVRFSEALTLLPILLPEAIPGLAIGCMLANIPMGIWDMLIGTVATLFAAIFTRLVKNPFLGAIMPVIFNAFLVPVIFLTMPEMTTSYWVNVLTVGAGELISVFALGLPLYFGLKKAQNKFPSLLG
jgi:uncharacterized membrane protein